MSRRATGVRRTPFGPFAGQIYRPASTPLQGVSAIAGPWLLRLAARRRRRRAIADDCDHLANFRGRPRADTDFRQPAGDDRLHFHRDLSVSTSNRLSPSLISSPTDLNQARILPSVTVSPSCGMMIVEVMGLNRSARAAPCRRFARRWAAPGLQDDRRPATECAEL